MAVLGIDIGKSEFHCAVLDDRGKPGRNSFPNSTVGFQRLKKWLANRRVEHVHACLEATGGWSEDLALFLHDSGDVVSIVNPLAIKSFGQSMLSRTKTDSADAELIARYCAAMNPAPWKPPSAAQRRLQQLVRRRAALSDMLTQERNRLQAPGADNVRRSITDTIEFLEKELAQIDNDIRSNIDDDPTLRENRDLLESIPGIGPGSSSTILGEIPNIQEFQSGKAVAAFAGLCPREFRSGTSVSASWLSKLGNRALRRAMYYPAIAAMRFNPLLAKWAAELKARGKRPKQVIAGLMRRLLVLAFGVLRTRRPFDPAFALDRQHRI
jgi:transposase